MRRLGVLVLALGLGACGVSEGPRTSATTRTWATTRTSSVAEAQRTHEYPARPPPQRARAGVASARAAVAAFAATYINWNAHTVARDMRRLAARSIGQARSAMQLAAAQTASDYELQRGGIANRGTVEAVAPLRGGGDRYVVVTREVTTATATTAYAGLQPAWHVAVVTLSREGAGGWVVSGWEPES